MTGFHALFYVAAAAVCRRGAHSRCALAGADAAAARMQLKEREEAERLRKLHTFHARPVPKSSRRGSAPLVAAKSPAGAKSPEAYPINGVSTPGRARKSGGGGLPSPAVARYGRAVRT